MGGKHRILVNFFVRRSPWNNRFETSVHSLQIPHNRGVDVLCKPELLEPQLTIRAASRMLLTGIPFKSNTIGLIPANLTYGIRTQPQFPAQPIHSSRLIARREIALILSKFPAPCTPTSGYDDSRDPPHIHCLLNPRQRHGGN